MENSRPMDLGRKVPVSISAFWYSFIFPVNKPWIRTVSGATTFQLIKIKNKQVDFISSKYKNHLTVEWSHLLSALCPLPPAPCSLLSAPCPLPPAI
jgi:hypothetical protein